MILELIKSFEEKGVKNFQHPENGKLFTLAAFLVPEQESQDGEPSFTGGLVFLSPEPQTQEHQART